MIRMASIRLIPLCGAFVLLACEGEPPASPVAAAVETSPAALRAQVSVNGETVEEQTFEPESIQNVLDNAGYVEFDSLDLLPNGDFHNPETGSIARAFGNVVEIIYAGQVTLRYEFDHHPGDFGTVLAAASIAENAAMVEARSEKWAQFIWPIIRGGFSAASKWVAERLCGQYISTAEARNTCAEMGRAACANRGGVASARITCGSAVLSRLTWLWSSTPTCVIQCNR